MVEYLDKVNIWILIILGLLAYTIVVLLFTLTESCYSNLSSFFKDDPAIYIGTNSISDPETDYPRLIYSCVHTSI